jgi:hypothetical protein
VTYHRLKGAIMAAMAEDLGRLSRTVGDCPFRVHVKGAGSDNDSFNVFFSLSDREPYSGQDQDVLAHASCTVLPQLYEGLVMMRVAVRQTKKELGRREHKWDEHDWTRQDWRYEQFVMECSAAPLWNLLERSVNFEKLAKKAASEVMES